MLKNWRVWLGIFFALAILSAIAKPPTDPVSPTDNGGVELSTEPQPLEQKTLDVLRLAYLQADPDKTVVLDQIVDGGKNWILARQVGTPHRGLWLYHDAQYWAVNGKAIAKAETFGYSTDPNAASIDIPAVLALFPE